MSTLTAELRGRRPLQGALDAVLGSGRTIFAIAIAGFGICNLAGLHQAGLTYPVRPKPGLPAALSFNAFPYVPAVALYGWVTGLVLLACGIGLAVPRCRKLAAWATAAVMLFSTLAIELPRYSGYLRNVALRSIVFEALALTVLAYLLPGRDSMPAVQERLCRFLLGLSLVVFGVDHFFALVPFGAVIPHWIPWHSFWMIFFGAALILAGVGIAADWLLQWSAGLAGLMFGLWVLTLHLPRSLGLYGIYSIPAEPRSVDEWSSLLIPLALCGGLIALVHHRRQAG